MISKRFTFNSTSILKLNSVQFHAKELVERKIKEGKYRFKQIKCPVCASEDHLLIAEKDRYGLPHKTVICKVCGLVFSNPQMMFESYVEFYNTEYRNLYVGSEQATALFFNRQVKKGEKIYKYILDSKTSKLEPGTKVLEIGCGAGGILYFFKQKGCEVMGIDLGGDYLEYGIKNYGLNLSKGSVEHLDTGFVPDIIIYSHVLEHITDLNSELLHISKILEPDALLYIEVPGIKNIHKNYKMNFLLYLQNAHTFNFSLTSLKNLMFKNQFECIVGNEEVQSIFKKSIIKIDATQVNDYSSVLGYLKKTEKNRLFYAFSFGNIKNNILLLLKTVFTFLGIQKFVVKFLGKN